MEEIKKNIDDQWKEMVAKEKEAQNKEGDRNGFIPPEPSFSFFIRTLALQASVFLGQIPDPTTNKKEKNLNQAKFIIDTLAMFRDKTKNNLNTEENNLLENMLYELRMQYVATAQSGAKD